MQTKKQKLTPYLATAIVEGFCEGEGATKTQLVEAWQYLIDIGLCWKLQGWFGRTAASLIENGICHKKEGKNEKLYTVKRF